MNVYSKAETNSQIQKTNLWLPVGREEGTRARQEYMMKKYKLLYIKLISNKTILYNTLEYSYYFVITFNGIYNL